MSVNLLTRPVSLSRRLEIIVELAGSGETVCDVGCDHAHVPIRLLQEGQYMRAIGMDVLPGPLGKAAGNLALYGMEDRIELRLSDGMDALCENEADTVVITGMGGTMMQEILLREPQKTRSVSKLVLGPQSDPDKVRLALRSLGFVIDEERITFEDGKYYTIMRAVHSGADCFFQVTAQATACCKADTEGTRDCVLPDSSLKAEENSAPGPEVRCGCGLFSADIPEGIRQEAEDLFGPVLLSRQDPLLKEYLVRQTAVLEKILRSISLALENMRAGQEGEGSASPLQERHLTRKAQIEHSLVVFRAALTVYESHLSQEARIIL